MTNDPLVLDLSHWNPVESWEALKQSGIVGIIYKVTEGSSYVDTTYDAAKKGARAAGLLWGAYHFLRPGDMRAQAKFFVDKVGEPIDLYCADHEDFGVTVEDLKLFMLEVHRLTGVKPILYSGHVIKEQVGNIPDPVLAQYRLWIAQYTGASQPEWPQQIWPMWWLWQYTEHGAATGVGGDVDMNRYSGAGPLQLTAEWGGGPAAPASVIVGESTQPTTKGVPPMSVTIDLSQIEEDINIAEDVAQKLAPFLFLIPGLGPYVGAITAAIPQIVKATNAIEQALGVKVGSEGNNQIIADHIDPEKPNQPALHGGPHP